MELLFRILWGIIKTTPLSEDFISRCDIIVMSKPEISIVKNLEIHN